MKNSSDNFIHFTLSKVNCNKPGIYVMYDKTGKVIYVGSSKNIHKRIKQHIIRQDSSVTTGASATSLNPEKISSIHWWLHEDFFDIDRLKAAELIAFDEFKPILSSRANEIKAAKMICNDNTFKDEIIGLLKDKPSGIYRPYNLINLKDYVQKLEERVFALEKQLSDME